MLDDLSINHLIYSINFRWLVAPLKKLSINQLIYSINAPCVMISQSINYNQKLLDHSINPLLVFSSLRGQRVGESELRGQVTSQIFFCHLPLPQDGSQRSCWAWWRSRGWSCRRPARTRRGSWHTHPRWPPGQTCSFSRYFYCRIFTHLICNSLKKYWNKIILDWNVWRKLF